MQENVYFLTGATGDLGTELIRHLGEDLSATVYCLVRDKNGKEHQDRLREALEKNGVPPSPRIIAVKGDVCASKLGMDDMLYKTLAQRISNIIHCAADVRFNQPLESIRKINVGGTSNLLEFAETCRVSNPGFNRMAYVCTAYVAGKRTGKVDASELTDRHGFRNTYEQSKFEAESIVRSTMAKGLPVTIFRPSIILGQSETGKFKSTSVLYPVLLLNQKLMPETVLPILRRTTLDLVPIDYVAGAILYLMLQPATRDKCFHLAAGSDATIYDGEFTQIIARCLELKNVHFVPSLFWKYGVVPGSRLLSPALYKRLMKLKVMNTLGGYGGYFREQNPIFAVDETRTALKGSGLQTPDSARLLRACVRYGRNTYLHNASGASAEACGK